MESLLLYFQGTTWLFWLSQFVIPFTGVTAIWLTQHKEERVVRWACIFGLIGQPFWFYATWKSQQWGMFFTCFFYLFAWFKGFHRFWFPLILKRIQRV